MKTAAEILAIPVDEPERLFPGHIDRAKKEYRRLASHWQPRTGAEDSGVMAHVNVLFDNAVDKIVSGTWATNGVLELDGFTMPYWRHRKFELGDAYVGMRTVVYSVPREHSDLVRRAQRRFVFADDAMRAEVRRYLPKVEDVVEAPGRLLFVVQKDAELICLRDALEHLGGAIDVKHVAWIMSRLYNIASYFQFAGLVHNHISPDTYFISPSQHVGALLGGWWYSVRVGERMLAAPQRTIEFAPSMRAVKGKKVGDPRVDLELIKATGRELLGDVGGSRLMTNKAVPRAMAEWLMTSAGNDALEEFTLWYEKVLPKSFGARRFVKLELTADDVYKGAS